MSKKQTDIDDSHPSEDTTGRFETDAMLRRNGWAIKERRHGEPLWVNRVGRVVRQSQLIEELARG